MIDRDYSAKELLDLSQRRDCPVLTDAEWKRLLAAQPEYDKYLTREYFQIEANVF